MSWMFEMGHIKHVHFVGIGGVGMVGIAEVLLRQGYAVSGSDLVDNSLTQWLRVVGATIHIGHDAKHVEKADVIVRSSAVDWTNPELVAAKAARIPIVPRAEMLGELMRFRYGIAVAGTHGKTTTTSFITSLLAEAGLDPTFVIGGRLNSAGSNARLGRGHYLVAEADESDASFLYLKPMISVVTNIDADHMETYQGDFGTLKTTFVEFLQRLPFYGLAVLCIDDPVVASIMPEVSRPVITYGFSKEAAFQIQDYRQVGLASHFVVKRPRKLAPLDIVLNMPGKHNVLNAVAAIAVASELKVKDADILEAMVHFQGIGRRFQVYGDFELSQDGQVTLVDDYGHHPREVAATYQAAKESWPDRRVVMVFQPHRYTRTRDLFEEFCQVLTMPDELILLDVYTAGEDPIEGANTASLIEAIQAQNKSRISYVRDHAELPGVLADVLQGGDVLLMQGAGNIGTLAQNLAASQLTSCKVETA